MKKLILLSLLLPLWSISSAAVQIQTLSADYANKRVTFALSWAAGTRNATHLSKVWVFVDYQEVTNPNTTGAWQRATVDLSALPAGGSADGANAKGFWYQGQATAAQSATITVALTNVPAKFNWCATATDYPPNVTATGGTYTLHGTAPFTLVAADGVSTQVVNGNSIAASALTVAPVTIRDATGCPGVFCPYTGTDLFVDGTHICQQRATGAQNWEAWIKDVRDDKLYRIVQMPNEEWWFAQSLAREFGSYYTYSGTLYYLNGSAGCPSGWAIPTTTEWTTLLETYGGANYNDIKTTTDWAGSGYAGIGNDKYGLSLAPTGTYFPNGNPCGTGIVLPTTLWILGPSDIYRPNYISSCYVGAALGQLAVEGVLPTHVGGTPGLETQIYVDVTHNQENNGLRSAVLSIKISCFHELKLPVEIFV